jgi:hypothetical protein
MVLSLIFRDTDNAMGWALWEVGGKQSLGSKMFLSDHAYTEGRLGRGRQELFSCPAKLGQPDGKLQVRNAQQSCSVVC